MTDQAKRRWERIRQAVGNVCLCLAALALLFTVITAPRTVREPDVYFASGRTGTPCRRFDGHERAGAAKLTGQLLLVRGLGHDGQAAGARMSSTDG